MTNAKHTPGPWRLRTDNPVDVYLDQGSQMFVIEQHSEDQFHIGFACSWRNDPSDAMEAQANAKLLASAPELYEALANLENDAGQIPDQAWQMVQCALAKARGES